MTGDYKSTIPEFRIGSVTFVCWVTDNQSRYEWRANDDRLLAGRNEGSGTCWASANGKRIGFAYPTLKAAMLAAVSAYSARKANAA